MVKTTDNTFTIFKVSTQFYFIHKIMIAMISLKIKIEKNKKQLGVKSSG